MSTTLEEYLQNATIAQVNIEHDYCILQMDCGDLCLYNPVTLLKDWKPTTFFDANKVSGAVISAVQDRIGRAMDIVLNNGYVVSLDMRSESYTTPEAFCFIPSDKHQTIVG